jgi:hypothetical protein
MGYLDAPMAQDVGDLLEHLARTTALPPPAAARLVDEVLAYFSESVEAFVVRRHRELRAEDLQNEAIFARIAAELGARRFTAPPLTERQIRRLIYG